MKVLFVVRTALLLSGFWSPAVIGQELPIGSFDAVVVDVAKDRRVTVVASVTDANGKPLEAFVRSFDHIGPAPSRPLSTLRGSFSVFARLCETFELGPQQGSRTACGWVPFKIDPGSIKVLKTTDPSIPAYQPSVYEFTALPNGEQIGTKDFTKPNWYVSFLVLARVVRGAPSGAAVQPTRPPTPIQLETVSQREAVAVWRTCTSTEQAFVRACD